MVNNDATYALGRRARLSGPWFKWFLGGRVRVIHGFFWTHVTPNNPFIYPLTSDPNVTSGETLWLLNLTLILFPVNQNRYHMQVLASSRPAFTAVGTLQIVLAGPTADDDGWQRPEELRERI